ncbi:MAG: thioesterase family protein [bacterium]
MLSAYPVVMDFVVRWGEMDALGHVNNTVFLQYFETARMTYLQRMGIEVLGLGSGEHAVILAANSCRYRVPVTYPDTLSVGTRVSALGKDRVIMEHAAVSQKLGRVVAEGDALVVSYDYVTGRPTPFRADYRTAIITLEGHEPPPLPPRARQARSSK